MNTGILFGLFEIVLINIVLSGDNAVVIAMACRNLDNKYQKKAIIIGSIGAIVLRVLLTFVAVYLLEIPFLNFVGGILLIWIAVKLLRDEGENEVAASANLFSAIKTIIVADLIMSLDNIVAVAGAANGSILLIVVGLGISIPLIIWGSQLLMAIMEKFPIIVIAGAALLGYTAGEMIVEDDIVGKFFEGLNLNEILPVILAVLVIFLGKIGGHSHKNVQHS